MCLGEDAFSNCSFGAAYPCRRPQCPLSAGSQVWMYCGGREEAAAASERDGVGCCGDQVRGREREREKKERESVCECVIV